MLTMTIATILLADDDRYFIRLQKPKLEKAGYTVITATTPETARKIIEAGQIDLAILDIHMRGGHSKNDLSGLELAGETSSSVPIIIMTQHPTVKKAVRALEAARSGGAGAASFVDKAHASEELLKAIRKVLKARVFIIHGHDDGAKQSVARFIESLGLVAVILHEQTWGGRTVIENFEEHSNVGFAIALLTPDDLGNSIRDEQEGLNPRARQNVIFELGFFIGKLGRSKVAALYKSDPVRGPIEIPSDYHGVRYFNMDAHEGWKLPLAQEIKSTGIDIDLNRII
jgi:predicted nucleotide-binding protein